MAFPPLRIEIPSFRVGAIMEPIVPEMIEKTVKTEKEYVKKKKNGEVTLYFKFVFRSVLGNCLLFTVKCLIKYIF